MSVPPRGVSAEDHAEIMNLYAWYNLCSDAGDAEGYAGCFAAAGVLRIDAVGIQLQGREAFVAFKRKDAAGRGGRYRRHWNGSIHLEQLADGAVRGRCYLVAYNGTPGELPTMADCGVYEDRIVKEDGRWLFAERRITMDGSTFKPPQ